MLCVRRRRATGAEEEATLLEIAGRRHKKKQAKAIHRRALAGAPRRGDGGAAPANEAIASARGAEARPGVVGKSGKRPTGAWRGRPTWRSP